MPSASLVQNALSTWHPPRRRKKIGRPRKPKSQLTNDALWKRAQRADNRPPDKGMIRHHVDRSYGRRSDKTVYMSRGQHNREHRRAAVTAEVKRRRRARQKARTA